jgi:hypothetical protein
MRQESLIWICYFMLITCASMAKNSDILYASRPDSAIAMAQLNVQVRQVAGAIPLPLPDRMDRLEQLSEPVGCVNIKGHWHYAMVLGDHEDDGQTRGGLYALTSKNGSQWDRVVRVYSSNSYAEPNSPAIACDTNEYVGGHKNGFRNRIYLVWVLKSTAESSSQYSQIFFVASADGGNTFGVPPFDGSAKWQYHPLRLNIGSDPASAPSIAVTEDGEVVVSWTQTDSKTGVSRQVSRRSSSGGAGFGQTAAN